MPISKHKVVFDSPAATKAWAKEYASTLKVGDVLALIGPLGRWEKQRLVQGLAAGWKTRAAVTSPTFSLVNEYASARGPMYHMDMYRLSANEIWQFPLDDYLGAGLCVIEWADRVMDRLPAHTRFLQLAAPTKTTRTLTLRGQ